MATPDDSEALLTAARETMAKVRDCWLATSARDGAVNVRVVSPIPRVPGEEDWTICFATKRSSRKAAEIGDRGRLTLGYQHHPDRSYVSLHGRAVLVEDRSIVRHRWSERFRPYLPGGPEDPDTILVQFHADRIELCVPGFTQEALWLTPCGHRARRQPCMEGCFQLTIRPASALVLIEPAIRSSGSSTRSSTAAGLRGATTGSPLTTLPSSSPHRSGYGCTVMIPRPDHIRSSCGRIRSRAMSRNTSSSVERL